MAVGSYDKGLYGTIRYGEDIRHVDVLCYRLSLIHI